MNQNWTLYLLSLLVLNTAFVAQGKWADVKEAQEIVLDHRDRIDIDASGGWTLIGYRKIKILTESARSHYLRVPFRFSKSYQTFELLEASITNNEKKIPITDVEIKETDTGGTAFDDNSVARITFRRLKIGSVIEMKVKMTSKPVFKGLFSYTQCLSQQAEYKKAELEIRSQLPLQVDPSLDPRKAFKIMKKKSNGQTVIVSKLRKPYFRALRREDYDFLYNFPESCVSFTSPDSFRKMSRQYSKDYSAAYNQPLPELYQKIIQDEAKDQPSFHQINRIIAALQKNIKYLGDWRSVEGKYLPRPLAEVAKSGYGDCKDYATGLVALLRNLGYEAFPALIYRNYNNQYAHLRVEGISSFNHVIAAVQLDGRTHFIDPTNLIVASHIIFSDIDDRPALILNHTSQMPVVTPSQNAHQGKTLVEHKYNLRDLKVPGHLKIQLQGYHAKRHTEWMMEYANDPSKALTDIYGDRRFMEDSKTISGPIHPKGPILTDLSFDLSFTQIPVPIRTPYGFLYQPPTPRPLLPFFVSTKDRFSGIGLQVGGFEFKYWLSHVKFQGDLSTFNCDIKTPWFHAKRTFPISNSDGSVIEDKIEIYKKSLSPKELQSQKFQKTREDLRKCFDGSAFIYK
ncbi:MAG: DUF3857 domain-containing transglutaminase family protein [Bdellovibrionales bacterium]|nr:DUF3857 domain-containing transglutaminase family protein [Bdellovibrionales bacterium]